MTLRARKLALTAHIVFSVAWIGAVAAFFALSIAGVTSQSAEVAHGAYLSMNLISLYIVIPLSLAALTTGLIQSLGTPWGLFRHYWVAVKFFLTLISVAVLLMHQYTAMAAAVRVASRAGGILPRAELAPIGFMLIRASGLGMLVLIIITTLSVYKPWGLTGRARRKQQAQLATSGKAGHSEGEDTPGFLNEPAREGFPRGLKIFLLASAGVLLAILIVSMHLTGNGFLYGH